MKSIDLICPPEQNDNSPQLVETGIDSAKLIESLTQKISEVVETQTASTEKLAETIASALKEAQAQPKVEQDDEVPVITEEE